MATIKINACSTCYTKLVCDKVRKTHRVQSQCHLIESCLWVVSDHIGQIGDGSGEGSVCQQSRAVQRKGATAI
jgi:hypothetical protein